MDANVEYINMRKNKPNKNYECKNHSKFILTYHIIFTSKYRMKLLIKYGEDVKQIMYDISKRYDFDIKEDLQLSDRWYVCDCGYENDRDYKAAMNIRDCGTRLLAW